ncbi:MAG: hypothetical protein LC650_00020 [Actinobacteria bacterium]|nr:hypothetical protein [Actinomycetota bacterium]
MSEANDKLQDVLSKLNKNTAKRVGIADAVEINRLRTPSIGLTRALSGGWALGRQNMLWGAKSAGKSTFVLRQIAIAQEMGMVCALLDVEATLDKDWSARHGVDNSTLIHSTEGTIVGLVNAMIDLLKAGVGFIAIDSIGTILPMTYLEKDGSLKDFESTGAIGGMARSIGPALSQTNYVLQQTENEPMVLWVSQVRSAQAGTHWKQSHMGGNAMEHAASQAVKLSSPNGNVIKGDVKVGDRLLEKNVGRQVDWLISKDKVGPHEGTKGDYTMYFDGDFVGIDNYAELVGFASEVGIIRKAGAWFAYGDEKLGQGEAKAAKTLRDNPELFKEIERKFYGE